MINTDKEEQLLKKRFYDLANTAYQRDIIMFSDFLNLNEQGIFFRMKNELPMIKYFSNGGFQDAERKILCFYSTDSMIDETSITFPIDCIKIVPVNHKFSDQLNHRDFLGAILNLGLDRSKIGDILIKDNEGYVFAHNGISGYITEQLVKVKHTIINTTIVLSTDFDYKPNLKEITGTVTSERLDSVLSVAFHQSRSSLSGLIEGGKVYVNGKLIVTNSYQLKENDVVSVRGLGKFIYCGTSYQTKKGRYSTKIQLYL